jgi:hypothetical protein
MKNMTAIGIRARLFMLLGALCLGGLTGCATAPGMSGASTEWTVLGLNDVKRIAEIRESISDLRPAFRDVLIVRLSMAEAAGESKRIDVTSIGPAVVSAVKDGAPAARTTFGFSENRDRMILLTQDVPARTAFTREIPAPELTVGKSFRFPVVQESGRIVENSFTVQQVIVR